LLGSTLTDVPLSTPTAHAWLEVRISDEALEPALTQRLIQAFRSSASILMRADGAWLQLSPEGTLVDYRVTHFIETSGKLITL
jgi:hypothetical protein